MTGETLSTKAVKGTARALECIDNIEGSDSFPRIMLERRSYSRTQRHIPLSVFSVCDRITNDVLQEDLQNTTSLLVDEARDTLDTATTSETTNSL
jgi:hypothetical protein